MSSQKGRRRGTPGPGRTAAPVGLNPSIALACATPGCGEPDAGAIAEAAGLPRPRVPDGWIYVIVRSSTVPGRWFCSGACAHRGITAAQLRPLAPPPPPQ